MPSILLPFSLVVLAFGSPALAALATIAVTLTLVTGSNAKARVLGEPLCFSDGAILRVALQHPSFYTSAVRRSTWILGCVMLCTLTSLLISCIDFRTEPRLYAIAATILSALLLRYKLRACSREWPAEQGSLPNVSHFGLVSTLIVQAARWWASVDPQPPPSLTARVDAPELIVVVQCESFMDHADLPRLRSRCFPPLAGLTRARLQAFRHGPLAVAGFGAYTMRSEYGVLFGRDEASLGPRRFDPYLTAAREWTHALPARLSPLGYRACFIHPFSMAFYGRDRLLPRIGFDRILGPEAFEKAARIGPYVADAEVADRILRLAGSGDSKQLIWAVTMENHGPHHASRLPACDGIDAWATHLQHADAMLERLIDGIAEFRRRALLVFYGDHRPFLTGASEPRDGRDTSYVVLEFDTSGLVNRGGPSVVCTPAQLNELIVACCAENALADDQSGGAVTPPARHGSQRDMFVTCE